MTPPTDPKPTAVVLLSGGLDSATVLAIARDQGFAVIAISFRYGQRHAGELDAARRVAEAFGVIRHEWVDIDLRAFGGSALTAAIDVPKDRDESTMTAGVPVTYVPARNTIFLSFALALAETTGSSDIFLGVNALDYSGYPDCRPEYIKAYESMARLATRDGIEGRDVTLHAPLIDLTKAQIIQRGLELGVDYGLTHSCYDPLTANDASNATQGDMACGRCDACQLRLKGFVEAGSSDPILYVPSEAPTRSEH